MAVLGSIDTTPSCDASRYCDSRWPDTKSEITSMVLASSRGTSAALTGTKRAWRKVARRLTRWRMAFCIAPTSQSGRRTSTGSSVASVRT